MEKIKHQALITSVKNGKICLKINHDNCASCAIASVCTANSNKEIELNYDNSQDFNINDRVGLTISPKTEKLGISLLYILPTLIVFVSLFIGQYLKVEEVVCAVFALAMGGLYFLLLYLCRKKLRIDFEILREDR